MSAEQLPKEFEKCTEVLPFTKYGLSSFEEFKKTEKEIQHLEWLKKIGLTTEEIKLYQDNEAGLLEQRKKVGSTIIKNQLEDIYKKIHECQNETKPGSSKELEPEPSTSESDIFERLQKRPITLYPEGHPMNEIKELEESLFGHLKGGDIMPITKRRKLLRRLERKKERIMAQEKELIPPDSTSANVSRKGSLWDVKEKLDIQKAHERKPILGPKKRTIYTIKDNKIVRLEPVQQQSHSENQEATINDRLLPNNAQQVLPPERLSDNDDQEYRAVDIVLPVNAAEEELLEGTKMCVDDIRKIERFKDYEPGIPSKVLYLKNIAPLVTQEQLSLLFNQFQLDNGGPIDVRLMTGRMRGQAFVSFNSEDLAIQALDEVNGTILSGRPVIAQFGRNSNRIQYDNDDNR